MKLPYLHFDLFVLPSVTIKNGHSLLHVTFIPAQCTANCIIKTQKLKVTR